MKKLMLIGTPLTRMQMQLVTGGGDVIYCTRQHGACEARCNLNPVCLADCARKYEICLRS